MVFKRASGILTHPTSFPGRYGIGDLGDAAYDFVDFLEKGRQTLWQVLPLNPTSFGDSPYQSFSTFAGNPLLISPDTLLKEGYLTEDDLTDIPDFDPFKVEYGKVIPYKTELYKKAYENFLQRGNPEQKAAYNRFCRKHRVWLEDYCLFIALKQYFIEQRQNTFESKEYLAYRKTNKDYMTQDAINDCFYGAVWNSWPIELAERQPEALASWRVKLAYAIGLQSFLQFEFNRQWQLLKCYANGHDVQIIGDIPIFVAHDSADVWSNTSMFLLDQKGAPTSVAGVPPDYFSDTGQLWGNPLYNWEVHEKTGYRWWIARISHILELVDILRIDHFRGFESYWAIPYGEETAISGQWQKGPGTSLFHAMRKALGDLPVIAEDLGVLTEEVEALRDDLDLPGMKVLQFGFDAGKMNLNMPHNLRTPYVVLYTGTHDNDTSKGWYESANAEIQDQFRRYANSSGEDAAWGMVRLAFLSIAVFAICPIQDLMSLGSEARMNRPGVAADNWQFRYTADMLADHMAEGLAYLSDLSDRNLHEQEDEAVEIETEI